ncbi:imelysin family protein [Nannocystaceae bacterium ST9]
MNRLSISIPIPIPIPIMALGLAVLGLAIACPEAEHDHRPEVLTNVGLTVLADLDEARGDAAALRDALSGLCASPDQAGLDGAQQAWLELRAPWKRLLALPFGPIVDQGFDSAIDFWPARPTSIEGALASGASDQADLDALGVASKGMPAIEYFLWDPIGGDAATLALFTAGEGPQRCAHVELLAADVELRLSELDAAWRGAEGFADQLARAGESETFPTRALAIDKLLNAMIAGLHDIDDPKLAKPLGAALGEPQPDLVESRFSDRSLLDARDALAGFAQAYLGSDEAPGLTLVVAGESASVDQRVRDALAAAEQALADVPEPLRTAIVDAPDRVAAAEQAVQALRMVLSAEVASLLGVTVSLSDNDGD